MAKKMGIIWVWLGGSTMDNLPNSWRVTPSTSRSGESTTYVTPTCKLNPSLQTPTKGERGSVCACLRSFRRRRYMHTAAG